jgi:hypothetical protein
LSHLCLANTDRFANPTFLQCHGSGAIGNRAAVPSPRASAIRCTATLQPSM